MSAPMLTRGDARALPLADESVDLIVTSPPYWALRDYGYDGQIGSEPTPREFITALLDVTREMARVLRPTGSIFVNLGDKYSGAAGPKTGERTLNDRHLPGGRWPTVPRGRAAEGAPPKSLLMLPERYRIACVDELGLIARAVVVWGKPNGLPESVSDRVRRSHEDWVHLTRSPRYYGDTNEIREPHTGGTHPAGKNASVKRWESGQGVKHRTGRSDLDMFDPRGKLPGSVWSIASQALNVPESVVHALCCDGDPREGCEDGVDHHAAFPMEWPRRLIAGWCPPGGTVLDPFGGTGTTALVAHMNGYRGISVELSAGYQPIARWRCSDPKERARAAGLDSAQVARIPAPREDQLGLFQNEVAG